MKSESQTAELVPLLNKVKEHSDWVNYARYCLERNRGLRKEAFKHLDMFLHTTQSWTIEQKIGFVDFILTLEEQLENTNLDFSPHPLSEQLIKPTLLAWCATETVLSKPFRWYGTNYGSDDHLLKAIEIEPFEDRARILWISRHQHQLNFSIHHLPEGYIGDPEYDLILGERIQEHINQLSLEADRNHWNNILDVDMEIIRNYVEWRASGHPSLEMWGMDNLRKVGYGDIRTYYFNSGK